MIRNIRIVLFFMDKKREIEIFDHGGRFHENVETLFL